jgi:hypothetical protein
VPARSETGGHLFYTVPIIIGRLTGHDVVCLQVITENPE